MLPPERQRLVDEAVGRLRDVEGIVAVALGGSWAIEGAWVNGGAWGIPTSAGRSAWSATRPPMRPTILGDKHALATIGSFDLRPDGYPASLERLLGHPGNTPQELRGSVAALEERFEALVKLAGDLYQPLHSL